METPNATATADAVIVGGGPTGLMLAAELRLGGADPVVLERLPEISQIPKGNGLIGQIVPMLDYRGLLGRLSAGSTAAGPVPRFGFGPLTLDITAGGPQFYYFLLAVFAIAVTLLGLLVRSPFGHTLRAIRENERRARFLAIPVERQIWLSFSISCFFTALAGTLYALLNNFADPLALHYSLSGYFVVMCVMGGMRTFWGPLLGAAVFVVLQDYISSMTVNWMSFVGTIFVLVVLFFPRGLLGLRRQRGEA